MAAELGLGGPGAELGLGGPGAELGLGGPGAELGLGAPRLGGPGGRDSLARVAVK